MAERTVSLPSGVALHARPAGAVVREASRHDAELQLRFGERTADARSIVELLSLGAGAGATMTIVGDGRAAEEAVAGLAALIGGFVED